MYKDGYLPVRVRNQRCNPLNCVILCFDSFLCQPNLLNMSADTLSFAGKTALVTGSSKENGIGAGIARALARNGASVAIHYVSESSKSRAETVASNINNEFGTKTTVIQGALENADTAKNMVEQILKAFSVDHIDILGMSWPWASCSFRAVGQN